MAKTKIPIVGKVEAGTSAEENDKDFGLGMTENMISILSQYRTITVLSSSTSYQVKKVEMSNELISRDLGVNYVVRGTVQFMGSSARANVELTDLKLNEVSWSKQLDFKRDDIFETQDNLSQEVLKELQINGMLRKPFEASMLKEQIGQYISIDENFGAEPIKEKENFAVDMSSIGSDLDEIKQKKQSQSQMNDDEINTIPDSAQKAQDSSHLESVGSNMDSLILEDILIDKKNRKGTKHKEDILNYEHDETTDVTESIMEDELIFSLRSGENSKNEITDTDLTKGGLEKLKMSGLEDKYAESLLFNENKESVQKHRVGLSNIDLENNDFEDPSVIWEHPPDLDQTPREGLTEINLEKNDFHPSFPKHLSSLEETSVPLKQEDKSFTDQISEMDTSLLQTESEESNYVNENFSDDLLLNDFEEKDGDGYGNHEDSDDSNALIYKDSDGKTN